jgi:hypothetical protein
VTGFLGERALFLKKIMLMTPVWGEVYKIVENNEIIYSKYTLPDRTY